METIKPADLAAVDGAVIVDVRQPEEYDAAHVEGARLVPTNRLMLETDSPYMAPEPMRGAACTPAHVIFTAAALAEIRGIVPGEGRKAFLEQVHANTLGFYGRNV